MPAFIVLIEACRAWPNEDSTKIMAVFVIPARYFLAGVLGDAIPERPVFLFDLDQADEHILRLETDRLLQTLGNGLVQRLLQLDCATFVQRDLNHDQIIGVRNVQIHRRVEKISLGVFADKLEPVLRRAIDRVHHRLVHDITDLAPVVGVLAFHQGNSNERHGASDELIGNRAMALALIR